MFALLGAYYLSVGLEYALCRWQVMAPSLTAFAGVAAALGHDIEYEIWRSLVEFQCSAVFAKYLQVRSHFLHCLLTLIGYWVLSGYTPS